MLEKKKQIGLITFFILGELFVFGFIVLLQFVSIHENLVGFIFTLIAMHIGIIFFILSKKLFKLNIKLTKHYLIEYIMLACYLPFLVLAIFKVNIDRNVKLSIIFALTAIVFVVSIINDYYLIKKLRSL